MGRSGNAATGTDSNVPVVASTVSVTIGTQYTLTATSPQSLGVPGVQYEQIPARWGCVTRLSGALRVPSSLYRKNYEVGY
jgi:hypothetical protein